MENKTTYAIGLMSGTSLDGVDLVYVKFLAESGYSFEILESESVEYSELWKNRLSEAFTENGENLIALDADYGEFLSKLILNFIRVKNIKKIDLIASHGHTIFHQPVKNYTLQIGNGAIMAAMTDCKVICDFRTQDVALGGQGAPLVPIGDELLFSEFDFCLNLGGFANISYADKGTRKAFDICPVNIVLNQYTRSIGLEFDDKGQMAAEGQVHELLLDKLNNLEFYRMSHPKSLGFEYVTESIFPLIEAYTMELKDILRTYAEHAAVQIAKVVNEVENFNPGSNSKLLVTGGGAYNEFFIQRLKYHLDTEVVIPDADIIEFKEALIFALLGVLRDQGKVNCLKSVTGARKDHSSGVVYQV